MDKQQLKSIIEALLFSADEPLSVDKIAAVIDAGPELLARQIKEALLALKDDYENHAIELKEVASGYRFQTRERYSQWIARLFAEKPAKYSRATIETLAIIAYKQPITRGEIEEIRGVSVSSMVMKNLLEREWIKVQGHKEVPGRPAIYVTTKAFLDYFNLKSLSELPSILPMPQDHPVVEREEI